MLKKRVFAVLFALALLTTGMLLLTHSGEDPERLAILHVDERVEQPAKVSGEVDLVAVEQEGRQEDLEEDLPVSNPSLLDGPHERVVEEAAPERFEDPHLDNEVYEAKYSYLKGDEFWREKMHKEMRSIRRVMRDEIDRVVERMFEEGAYQTFPYSYDEHGNVIDASKDENIPEWLRSSKPPTGVGDSVFHRWRSGAHLVHDSQGEHHCVILEPGQHPEVYEQSREAYWLMMTMSLSTWE